MLEAGTKLGPYEITGALGAGGMGEVYRARDTRLGRDVAAAAPPLSSLTQSLNPAGQTPTELLTARGTVLGTFQYMSPEQMEGKETDARSDIFSFGAVLYEMATGRRAFDGKTTASVIAAILEREPPAISSVQPMSPPALDRVVKVCLAKEPDERFQSMRDVKLQLEWIRDAGSQAGLPVPVATRRKTRARVAWATAAVLLIIAAIFAAGYFLRAPTEEPAIRALIKPVAGTSMASYNGGTAGFAISPDGLKVVYVALGPDGRSLLWVRSLDSLQGQALDGTDGASMPFWSPDSRFIGFFAGGKLKKIEASGGPPLTLAEAPGGRGGTWTRDGTILFTPFFGTPVFRVSDEGAAAAPVTTLNRSNNESTNRWPYFLPDGRHFLYLAGNPLTPVGNPTNSILVGSLDSKETKFLFHNHSNAIYASGYILFLRQNTLMAQPFDVKRLELAGEAVPIAEDVEDVATRVQGSFSASDNGTLAYLEEGGITRQMLWFDRSGKQIGAIPGTDSYADPHISPDGKQLAFILEAPSQDVWLYDMARGVKTRFTFGSGNESPRWSRDGSRIAYTSVRNGEFGIYAKAADGSGHEEVLVPPEPEQIYPLDWSPDGKLLAYLRWELGTNAQSHLWILSLNDGKSRMFSLLQASASPSARFSPDGKWLAYSSTESGRAEVYVTPFPGPGGKWQISTDGGSFPVWRHDAKELFYMSRDDKIMAAEVSANGQSFVIGAVKPLFQTRAYFGLFTANLFDVTADGQRFIVPYDSGQVDRTISLVLHWPGLLKKQ